MLSNRFGQPEETSPSALPAFFNADLQTHFYSFLTADTLFNFRLVCKATRFNTLAFLLTKLSKSHYTNKLSWIILALYLHFPASSSRKLRQALEECASHSRLTQLTKILILIILLRLVGTAKEESKALQNKIYLLVAELRNAKSDLANAILSSNPDIFPTTQAQECDYIFMLPKNKKIIDVKKIPDFTDALEAAIILHPLVKDPRFCAEETFKKIFSDLQKEKNITQRKNLIFILYALEKLLPKSVMESTLHPIQTLISLPATQFSSISQEEVHELVSLNVKILLRNYSIDDITKHIKASAGSSLAITSTDNIHLTQMICNYYLLKNDRKSLLRFLSNVKYSSVLAMVYNTLTIDEFFHVIKKPLTTSLLDDSNLPLQYIANLICQRQESDINFILEFIEKYIEGCPFENNTLPISQFYGRLLSRLSGALLQDRIARLQGLCLDDKDSDTVVCRQKKRIFYAQVYINLGFNYDYLGILLSSIIVKRTPIHTLLCSGRVSPAIVSEWLLAAMVECPETINTGLLPAFYNCLLADPGIVRKTLSSLREAVSKISILNRLSIASDLELQLDFLLGDFTTTLAAKNMLKEIFIAGLNNNQIKFDAVLRVCSLSQEFAKECFETALAVYQDTDNAEKLSHLTNTLYQIATLQPSLIGDGENLLDKIIFYQLTASRNIVKVLTENQIEKFIIAICDLDSHEVDYLVRQFLIGLLDRLLELSENTDNHEHRRDLDLLKLRCLQKLFRLKTTAEIQERMHHVVCSIRHANPYHDSETGQLLNANPIIVCYDLLLSLKMSGFYVDKLMLALIPKLPNEKVTELSTNFAWPIMLEQPNNENSAVMSPLKRHCYMPNE